MKQIQVLIVDDDANSLRLSLQAMQQLVEPAGIFTASNASETLQILQTQPIALAFLDIDMPDTSGFSIADYIRQHKPDTKYVFLTGYVDFAVRSFDYEPLDFLIKPIDLMRLKKTLDRFEAHAQPSASNYTQERIAVDTSIGFVLLSPDEITCIGKDKRVIKIHCENGEEYIVRRTMDEMESVFSDFGFFRIHQSYLVPLSRIISVQPSKFGKTYEAVLSNHAKVPVSREKYQKLRNYLVSRGIHFI